jgi:hypothetical protein
VGVLAFVFERDSIQTRIVSISSIKMLSSAQVGRTSSFESRFLASHRDLLTDRSSLVLQFWAVLFVPSRRYQRFAFENFIS